MLTFQSWVVHLSFFMCACWACHKSVTSASPWDFRFPSIFISNTVFSPLHSLTAWETCPRYFPLVSSNSVSASSANLTARGSVQPKVTFWKECVSRALTSLQSRRWTSLLGCMWPCRALSCWYEEMRWASIKEPVSRRGRFEISVTSFPESPTCALLRRSSLWPTVETRSSGVRPSPSVCWRRTEPKGNRGEQDQIMQPLLSFTIEISITTQAYYCIYYNIMHMTACISTMTVRLLKILYACVTMHTLCINAQGQLSASTIVYVWALWHKTVNLNANNTGRNALWLLHYPSTNL